ncbi:MULTISPECIES: Na+/H+ antiporter NhaA [unclassified Actinomyces]|uniref:Na+/H+ antiporter NhaA n=1 Tax=unclassified Actinomyces TaxID=2609248 RepID=UPI00201763DF|nr:MULTISPECIES: Na+/H+ antiporter NhaA [unclassified Actinomyces]MCL3776616.1 Na+/H+ antiporter NhaA [Actinomyces sp. AC-20-1]MCL3790101.1 Na+/H+ antiporter NhaA [Actinomyces sp. 187325]MCL3792403.1 Na+/H+ antiporter NhaA [Actinomyces sp. 186855]MCL3793482.1 Na+/H+ antiporter NhaA [Actinomyces sp. 217892]
MTPQPRTPVGLLGRLAHKLEDEVFSGLLMVAAAAIALIWANSPLRGSYEAVSHAHFGPAALHLDLSVAHWAADGVLAIFFLVVGLELKQEFVVGSLRDLKEAALPMIAAAFGMVGPALVYVLVQLAGDGDLAGWAVPTATDIAFAVALLSIFGRGLPPAARTFLLTLAVVDDLLAIIVIALFYSGGISLLPLLGALAVVAVFAVLVQRGLTHWYVLIPLGVVAWGLMHASGVHATIAGVLLGLVVPARPTRAEPTGMTARFTHLAHPWSAGLALPVFALFAAGVNIVDSGGLALVLSDPVAIGIYLGLPLGKVLGIWGCVVVLTRYTRLHLGHGIDNQDVLALSALAGIGFTVSLLIAGLAFTDPTTTDHARAAVLLGTLIAAVLGAVLLRLRVRTQRRGPGANAHGTADLGRPERGHLTHEVRRRGARAGRGGKRR